MIVPFRRHTKAVDSRAAGALGDGADGGAMSNGESQATEILPRNQSAAGSVPRRDKTYTVVLLLREASMVTNRATKSAGTGMLSVLTHLRQNFLGLAILTAAGVILWSAGWEVIGIFVTVVGGFGLFGGLVAAADIGGGLVTEAYGRSDNDALRLSKDEARLVTLIRDKNIDPSTIIARIQEAE